MSEETEQPDANPSERKPAADRINVVELPPMDWLRQLEEAENHSLILYGVVIGLFMCFCFITGFALLSRE